MDPLTRIETGTTALGLRWASEGPWRIVAYQGGGYARNRRGPSTGQWFITSEMPSAVERRLCAALSIPCQEGA
ncbi:MAG: hypothetical protein L0Z62_34645 [Gemmataceae bacterium]|nr:hypothetical protein [Gemmataceae bacterium]